MKKKGRTSLSRTASRATVKPRSVEQNPAPKNSARSLEGHFDPPACVLTIAGSDSSGGAGIQADARAIHALGGYAATAITAITAQSTKGVLAVDPISPTMLARQLQAVLDDLPIAAIKIGLLPSQAAVEAIAEILDVPKHMEVPLIIDPVLGSTSGKRFLSAIAVRRMKLVLFARAALVTPNWPEAAELSGLPIRSYSDAEAAARLIIERTGCAAILVKGGHAPGRKLIDVLVKNDGAPAIPFEHTRIKSANTHGTGCVLSAAIATRLAQGWTLENAVGDAVDFLQVALENSAPLLWNGRGACLI